MCVVFLVMAEIELTLRDDIWSSLYKFLGMAEIEGTTSMRGCIVIFDVCWIFSDGRKRGDYEGLYHDICMMFVVLISSDGRDWRDYEYEGLYHDIWYLLNI